jgi:hypothetical protein
MDPKFNLNKTNKLLDKLSKIKEKIRMNKNRNKTRDITQTLLIFKMKKEYFKLLNVNNFNNLK